MKGKGEGQKVKGRRRERQREGGREGCGLPSERKNTGHIFLLTFKRALAGSFKG